MLPQRHSVINRGRAVLIARLVRGIRRRALPDGEPTPTPPVSRGTVRLFGLARRIVLRREDESNERAAWVSASVALAYYFVLPFSVQASRSFQPDPGMVMWIALASRGVWASIKDPVNVPADAMEVRVTAKQFEWNVDYPGPDGTLGTADDFTTRNRLEIPVGRPVNILLRSDDVIHSFWVREMRVKQDAVPGMEIQVWFQPTVAGEFKGNGKPAKLADLRAGDKVKVDYEKLDDVLSVSVTREG